MFLLSIPTAQIIIALYPASRSQIESFISESYMGLLMLAMIAISTGPQTHVERHSTCVIRSGLLGRRRSFVIVRHACRPSGTSIRKGGTCPPTPTGAASRYPPSQRRGSVGKGACRSGMSYERWSGRNRRHYAVHAMVDIWPARQVSKRGAS